MLLFLIPVCSCSKMIKRFFFVLKRVTFVSFCEENVRIGRKIDSVCDSVIWSMYSFFVFFLIKSRVLMCCVFCVVLL
jgi:hypothetical protein